MTTERKVKVTLKEVEELFIRAITTWPMNETRRKRVINAILDRKAEVFLEGEHKNAIEQLIRDLWENGCRPLSECTPDQLFEEALDLFALSNEEDWAEYEAGRLDMLEWLDDVCGIPTEDLR